MALSWSRSLWHLCRGSGDGRVRRATGLALRAVRAAAWLAGCLRLLLREGGQLPRPAAAPGAPEQLAPEQQLCEHAARGPAVGGGRGGGRAEQQLGCPVAASECRRGDGGGRRREACRAGRRAVSRCLAAPPSGSAASAAACALGLRAPPGCWCCQRLRLVPWPPGVPRARSPALPPAGGSAAWRALPKSPSLSAPQEVSSRFPGLMSRCTTPAACTCARPCARIGGGGDRGCGQPYTACARTLAAASCRSGAPRQASLQPWRPPAAAAASAP